jgi:hypothetical protein
MLLPSELLSLEMSRDPQHIWKYVVIEAISRNEIPKESEAEKATRNEL